MKRTKKTAKNPWLIVLSVSLGLNVLVLGYYVLKPEVNKLVLKKKKLPRKKRRPIYLMKLIRKKALRLMRNTVI